MIHYKNLPKHPKNRSGSQKFFAVKKGYLDYNTQERKGFYKNLNIRERCRGLIVFVWLNRDGYQLLHKYEMLEIRFSNRFFSVKSITGSWHLSVHHNRQENSSFITVITLYKYLNVINVKVLYKYCDFNLNKKV